MSGHERQQEERIHIGIGLFVFGAVLLALAGAFFMYSHYRQGQVETYVMFFKGSLDGLDNTSPVTYRGVKIGAVTRVELTENSTRSNVAIPVYVEFFIEKSLVQQENPIQILIKNGVVATISAPNIFTGTAKIELRKTKKVTSQSIFQTYHGYSMFPTENMTGDEEDTNINDALKAARKAFEDISTVANSKEFKDSIRAFKDMATGVNQLAGSLNNQVPAALLYFNGSLKQFGKASYSVRILTDYLTRHPESLLRGKQ